LIGRKGIDHIGWRCLLKNNNLILLLILLISIFICGATGYKLGKVRTIEENSYLLIHNPFSRSFSIDIKCNWDGRKYLYDKRVRLIGMKETLAIIPNSSKCKIWPVF
jgi:hypothetical protein